MWDEWYPTSFETDELHPILGIPFRELRPWYLLKPMFVSDLEVARDHGRFIWEYYAHTTPFQRAVNRVCADVAVRRQNAIHEHYRRHPDQG